MVVKKTLIFIFFLFFFINTYSNVLYKNENFVVTDIDLEIYIKLNKDSYGIKINSSRALKDLILIKNVIEYLKKNNAEFIKKIDQAIVIEFGNKYSNDENIHEYLRFSKIRDEFIINYFNNDLNIDELKSLFRNTGILKLPISTNDCLIIDDVINLQNNNQFVEGFYNKLKNNSERIFVLFNDINYQVCIDEDTFKSIEGLIVKYIQDQTSEEFEKFIYDKASN